MWRLLLIVPSKSLYQLGWNYPQSRPRLCENAFTTWRATKIVNELIDNAASTSFPEFVLPSSLDPITARNHSELKYLKSDQERLQSAFGTS